MTDVCMIYSFRKLPVHQPGERSIFAIRCFAHEIGQSWQFQADTLFAIDSGLQRMCRHCPLNFKQWRGLGGPFGWTLLNVDVSCSSNIAETSWTQATFGVRSFAIFYSILAANEYARFTDTLIKPWNQSSLCEIWNEDRQINSMLLNCLQNGSDVAVEQKEGASSRNFPVLHVTQ